VSLDLTITPRHPHPGSPPVFSFPSPVCAVTIFTTSRSPTVQERVMSTAKGRARVAAGIIGALLIGVALGYSLARGQKPNRGASAPGGAESAIPSTALAGELEIRPLLEKVGANRTVGAGFDTGRSTVDQRSGICQKYDSVIYRLKDPGQGQALAESLREDVERLIESKGGTIWLRNGGTNNTGSAQLISNTLGYRLSGRRGYFFIWSTLSGEVLSLAVFFSEVEGEFETP
jgi:hypothetical protein